MSRFVGLPLTRNWADAQADLSFRFAHTYFIGFAMSWLILVSQVNHLTEGEGIIALVLCSS